MGRAAVTRNRLWGCAVAASAALVIAAAPWALHAEALSVVFKPLTTALLIAYASSRGRAMPDERRWVLIGLAFSWCGDVALLWPREGFLPGLIGFLLAHLAYLRAFTRGRRLAERPAVFLVYAGVAAAILGLLWPGVPAALRAPVLAYVVCLATMAAQAGLHGRRQGLAGGGRNGPGDGCSDRHSERRGRVLALGGALFMTSDTLLAINKFAMTLPLASLWILGSYWAAQWCIASWLAPRR